HVAQRLIQAVPDDYAIARFGGDEFIILIPRLEIKVAESHIKNLIIEIASEINKPFYIGDNKYSISTSAGYDIFSKCTISAADIIKHADIAMYEAKHSGVTDGLIYDRSMSEKIDRKLMYTNELKYALVHDEFELHYQPQYDHQQHIIGAEALLRWNNPRLGYESPAIFIPIAEQSDLIIGIDKWVLDRACRDIKIMEETVALGTLAKISINISAKHLTKDYFIQSVISAVEQHGIDASHLSIEITEGIMVGDIEKSIRVLEELKQHHIECSIDDFGTGYSSLTYLKKLPASLIKIDRSFVQDLHKDSDNRSIANMIIDLGDNLHMDVIAEGVECQEEVDCLYNLGCRQYQGFFFCKPIPFDQFMQLITPNTFALIAQSTNEFRPSL
ncbi:MAG: bifunctional diguanylate cyclase/phosphodiesterase, partial [Pseudomonadota bacterium]